MHRSIAWPHGFRMMPDEAFPAFGNIFLDEFDPGFLKLSVGCTGISSCIRLNAGKL